MSPAGQRSARGALLLCACLFLVYNSNGREIQSYDSQPTKLAAREFALHGRLTLDTIVAATPEYGRRDAFQRDRAGHFRSAYSVVPSLLAAIPAALLHVTRLVDLRAPLAPNLIATLTASSLTAAAVALVFIALARVTTRRRAVLIAIGLGLGTNLWPLASRTLWQLETVTFGIALALAGWFHPDDDLPSRDLWIGAAGLALAGCARPSIAPMALVLVAGLVLRGRRRAIGPLAVIAAAAIALMAYQDACFGHVLGATPALQAASERQHAVTGTLSRTPWIGALGLLVSPSRGLLVFSPIVLIALIGVPRLWRSPARFGGRWWIGAAAVQFACYSCYSMWWGGHTFGPRYLIDLLVPLAPAAADGLAWVAERRTRQWLAGVALAWSVLVAGTGAFCYPNDVWNSDPDDIDTHHARLWDWRDPQILRCWREGPSPQNFSLWSRAAVRQDQK